MTSFHRHRLPKMIPETCECRAGVFRDIPTCSGFRPRLLSLPGEVLNTEDYIIKKGAVGNQLYGRILATTICNCYMSYLSGYCSGSGQTLYVYVEHTLSKQWESTRKKILVILQLYVNILVRIYEKLFLVCIR